MYNNTTAELSLLPLSEAQEDSPPSVCPLACTAPVTEPSFTQSPASSAHSPGDLIPPPLPEALPQTPSALLPNPGSALGNFLSPSPPGQTLPPEPLPPLESKFPLLCSTPQPQNSFSSNLAQCDFRQELPSLQTTKTSSGGDTAAKVIDPRHRLFLSPDERDSVQQYSHPKTKEDQLKQKLIQLFWGLPSLHSESLASAVHVSGDCSSKFIFNSLTNASTGHEAPVLPFFLPPHLLELQPQSLPQTLSQSQPVPLTQIQLQAHLQPPLPVLSYGFIPKNRASGVHFHGPQKESKCLTLSEIQHLEWNVLQRKQQSLKDLPSMVQKSREDFCPSVPKSTQCWLSKAYISSSIDPIGFPLNSELQEKLEHHLRKRLIQHRWGLPLRAQKSLSLMRLPNNCSDSCESKSSYDLSRISVCKGQCNQSGSSYEKGSEMVQLEEDEGVGEGQSQESDPKDSFCDSESSSEKDVGSDSEKDLTMTSRSEESSVVSGQSEGPRHLRKVLQVHLSKKFEETSDSQLHRTAQNALHSNEETRSIKFDTEIKQRRSPASAGGDYCLNTSQKLSFLEPGTQQMLEAHITKLRIGISWGLPSKVLESMEIFQLKDNSSHSLFDPQTSSSTNLLMEVNSKPGSFMPLKESCKPLHGEKVGTENSATVPTSPLPATSVVEKKGRPSSGQGTQRQSPSNIKHGPVQEVSALGDARPTLLPVTNSIAGKTYQGHFPIANIHSPKLPSSQAGARCESGDKSMNSSDRVEMQLGRKMEEKAEPASMSNVFREIVEAKVFHAVQYNTRDIMTTNKPGISQRINVSKTIGKTPVTTKVTPPETLDLKSSDLNQQLLDELKSKLKKKKDGQIQGQPTNMSHDTNKDSMPGAQGVSNVDTGASQVLHVHLEDQTVNVEKQQEPWVPEQALRLCPDKNFPPASKKVSPTSSKAQELGGGDAGLVRSQPGGNTAPPQVMFEDTAGSRSPQTLSQKRQCPPDSLFINKMKSFFQRLQPRVICTKQENPQGKGSPRSCAQSRGTGRSRAAVMGTTETQKATSDIGKFPEKRLGPWHAGDTNCPQEPLLWAVRCETAQQRAAARVLAKPVQWPALHPRAPAYSQSCRQAAVFAGQNPTSIIHTRNDGRHPQKVGAFGKDLCLYHQHPQSVPRSGTVTHHPSPTCRPHPAQRPPAALTTGQGTVFRRPCLFMTPKLLL
ncbi:spermatogenesis-associated protein 31D1-like [Phyllostomus discolor]|uniref:Spermatogenesis-associated protein 31D1-like n=1 Tax=Phyllostomus discolor TaxID=89673 RepID=A0A6J2L3H2_9CHIR|nr:spermatogenesis-associated protein 31D1-like [Phyllostomus discolor]